MPANSRSGRNLGTCLGPYFTPSKLVASAVFLLAVTASAGAWTRERVLVCPFEGPRGTQLRWRVSSVVKKAGHTSLRYKAPPFDASDRRLSRYANRLNIDAYIFGTTEQDDDGSWSLQLTIKGPDAEIYDDTLVYRADTLGKLVKLLKREGKVDLVEAVLPYEDEPEPTPPPVAKRRRAELELDNDQDDVVLDNDPESDPESDLDDDSDGDPMADVELDDNLDSQNAARKRRRAKAAASEKSQGKRLRALFSRKSSSAKKKKRKQLADNPVNDEWDVSESDSVERDDIQREMDDTDSSTGIASTGLSETGEDELADSSSTSKRANALLRLGAGAGFISRDLSYSDNVYNRLRDQNTNVWVYQVQAELFPFAAPLNDRVSLVAGYESALSGTVQDNESNAEYGIGFSEYFAGVRLVQPLGAHHVVGQATIGNLTAGLDDPDGLARVPEFSYSMVRASLALVLDFGPWSVEGKGGYEVPLSYGEAGEAPWFPRIDGKGFEVGAGLNYELTPSLSFAFSSALRQLTLNINAQPQDAVDGSAEVAGGAIDRYLSAHAGLTVKL